MLEATTFAGHAPQPPLHATLAGEGPEGSELKSAACRSGKDQFRSGLGSNPREGASARLLAEGTRAYHKRVWHAMSSLEISSRSSAECTFELDPFTRPARAASLSTKHKQGREPKIGRKVRRSIKQGSSSACAITCLAPPLVHLRRMSWGIQPPNQRYLRDEGSSKQHPIPARKPLRDDGSGSADPSTKRSTGAP